MGGHIKVFFANYDAMLELKKLKLKVKVALE